MTVIKITELSLSVLLGLISLPWENPEGIGTRGWSREGSPSSEKWKIDGKRVRNPHSLLVQAETPKLAFLGLSASHSSFWDEPFPEFLQGTQSSPGLSSPTQNVTKFTHLSKSSTLKPLCAESPEGTFPS